MMEFVNLAFSKGAKISKSQAGHFLRILAPFAPHITEELWSKLGNQYSIHRQNWPEVEESALREEQVTIVVQVDGRVRDKIIAKSGEVEERLRERVIGLDKIKKWLKEKQVKRVIVVPDRLVNVVTAKIKS